MNFQIVIDQTDRSRLLLRLHKYSRLGKDAGRTALLWGAEELRTYIKNVALSGGVLNERSGRLKRSIKIREEHVVGYEGAVYEVYSDERVAPYGRFHEFGVRHGWDIYPKEKKALRFKIGDRVIFATHVWHPPLKMRSFLREPARQQGPRITQEIVARLQRAFRDI